MNKEIVEKESADRIKKLDSNYNILFKKGFCQGFGEGVEFIQSKPIFERLNEDERNDIRIRYLELLNERKKAMKIKDYYTYNALSIQIKLLEEIFGVENLK